MMVRVGRLKSWEVESVGKKTHVVRDGEDVHGRVVRGQQARDDEHRRP